MAIVAAVSSDDRNAMFQESRSEAPLGNGNGPHNPPLPDDELPSDISDISQLPLVPPECLSGDETRPLLHIDDLGNKFLYALQPMTYSVFFILMVELLERFSFYGYYYTLTLYLTGAYNEDWNAGFASVEAASYVSMSTMVAYTTPFVGAFLADAVWGEHKSILFGLLCFYVPGVLLMTLTSVPGLLGEVFNSNLLKLALLALWPMGTGIVKSIVNVFGAKQFHPLLQSSLVESYYVKFYMCINTGGLAGIIFIPIIAQHNLTLAYCCPLVLLFTGAAIFLAGTPRYVRTPPRGDLFSFGKKKRSRSRKALPSSETIPLSTIFRIVCLIVPFSVGYNQMPTTFIVQGTVMSNAFGVIDVASMNSLDCISVLCFGWITAHHIYPALNKRGIKLPTTYKFAIGSCLGSLAICWALFVEHMIHSTYHATGEKICVLWQAPSYILIGWGEIFAVSAAYEVAFTASSPDKKVLASATNIFCVGGLPNVFCIFLYHSCSRWFENQRGTTEISHIDDYATANIAKYFCVLLCIMLSGVVINTLPAVRDFVTSVEDRATDLVKTPVMRKERFMRGGDEESSADERSPLVNATGPLTPGSKRYQQYLKYGQGPVLYKMGSMRAGPSMSQSNLPGGAGGKAKSNIKYKYVPKLYHSEAALPQVALGPDGKPISVGQQKKLQKLSST